VNQLGLKLSFVDIDPFTLNIDTSKIEERITSSTSAIFAVNLLGNPADWIALRQLSEKYGLVLLEDNCESLGASLNNQQTGTFGVGGTFSTFFSHHISTMEGGLVATNDPALNDALRSIRAHGWTRDLQEENSVFPKTGNDWEDLFRFVLPGYNLRPLEMEAAIGREQIRKLPNFVKQRRQNASLILKQKDSFPNIQMQLENGNSSWFGFSFVLNGNLTGRRRELIQELDTAGIESRPIVGGNFTKNPVMKHLDYEPLPDLSIADHIHANGFFVGNHHYDLTQELEHLVEILTNFERKFT
jgi:CDP-6-deoxy-D-xylo-4-hexulose-3-dehydrase